MCGDSAVPGGPTLRAPRRHPECLLCGRCSALSSHVLLLLTPQFCGLGVVFHPFRDEDISNLSKANQFLGLNSKL